MSTKQCVINVGGWEPVTVDERELDLHDMLFELWLRFPRIREKKKPNPRELVFSF